MINSPIIFIDVRRGRRNLDDFSIHTIFISHSTVDGMLSRSQIERFHVVLRRLNSFYVFCNSNSPFLCAVTIITFSHVLH